MFVERFPQEACNNVKLIISRRWILPILTSILNIQDLVVPIYPQKLCTTTIKDTNQKAVIFNICRCILQ